MPRRKSGIERICPICQGVMSEVEPTMYQCLSCHREFYLDFINGQKVLFDKEDFKKADPYIFWKICWLKKSEYDYLKEIKRKEYLIKRRG